MIRTTVFAILLSVAASASATIVEVIDLKIEGFDFQLTPLGTAGFFGKASSSEDVNSSDNLVSGAVDPLLSFRLENISFSQGGTNTGSESWRVTARTTTASPATVDTSTNMITIDLSSFVTAWEQTAVVGPRLFRGCNGSTFPLCNNVSQSPPGGLVTGPWDPMTGAFEVAWMQNIGRHPFPTGRGDWVLRGEAVIPLPGALGLMLLALGSLVGVKSITRQGRGA